MIRKILHINFFIVLFSALSFGQYYRAWNSIYPSSQGGGLQGFESVVDQNGYVYLGIGKNGLGPPYYGSYLMKYDPHGYMQWEHLDSISSFGTMKISRSGFLHIANSNNIYPNYYLTLRKLDANGKTLWTYKDVSNSTTTVNYYNNIDFDSKGNIIAAGTINSGGIFALTSKIDTLGNLLWKKQINFGGYSSAYSLLIDASDNIYVSIKNGIVKYSPTGAELWSIPLDFWTISAISFDKQGNIYAVGITNSTHLMGTNKIDPNGKLLWSQTFGYGDAYGTSIAMDSVGNVYVAGAIGATNNPYSLATGVLLKYTPNGNLIWSKNYSGTSATRAINTNNSISITTIAPNKFMLYGTFLNNSTFADCFLSLIDTSGAILWQDIFHSNNPHEECQGWWDLNIDNDKNIYMLGGHGTCTGNSMDDLLLMKYTMNNRNSSPSIHGNLYYDVNQDCILDSTESKLEGKIIGLIDSTKNLINYAMTDTGGNFYFYAPIGKYQIDPVPPKYWISTCNNGVSLSIDSSSSVSYNNKLGLFMLQNVQDLRISVGGGHIRAGHKVEYNVFAENSGTKPMSGNIVILHDSILHFVNATPPPDSVFQTKLVWNYSNLLAGKSTKVDFTLAVDTSVSFNSTIDKLYAIITPVLTDTTPENNIDSLLQFPFGPYDPNHKSVNFQDTVYKNDTSFTYMIQFQNLGNDTAFNVVLRDTISDLFELASVEMGASSYPYSTRFIGNVMFINFKNISLPPKIIDEANSQGFVKYSIKRIKNIAPGTRIINRAAIYFDYMPPVITNDASNIYLERPLTSFEKLESLKIFPNPADFSIAIQGIRSKTKITLYDMLGKLLKEEVTDSDILIETHKLTKGIYLLITERDGHRVYNKVLIVR
ncbi:MAG: T9SS type A sorting domain-containing protein [Bacteroidia bacterium]|nr:T9SS type A sorting domain-containing protein [Bacteroidia bacterium]